MRYCGEPKGKTRVCPACYGMGADMEKAPIPVTIIAYDEDFNRVGENCYPFARCPYCAGLGRKEDVY